MPTMPHTNQVDPVPHGDWDPRIRLFVNAPLVQIAVVITARYVVLVDTLINPATAQSVMAAVEPECAGRQLLVVNTHADYDHAWGNQLFVGDAAPYPAPIIAHRLCADILADAETADYLRAAQSREPTIFGDVRLTPPTLLFDSELIIDGGDLTLHCFHTPGHTPDHISIYLPEIDTLLAGDAAELPFPFADSPADLPRMRASMARLASLHPARVLYCHAPNHLGAQLIHDNLAYFDRIEEACRAALAAGLNADELSHEALIAAVGCRFEEVTPAGGAWADVDDETRIERHAEQLRDMLSWLQSGSSAPNP